MQSRTTLSFLGFFLSFTLLAQHSQNDHVAGVEPPEGWADSSKKAIECDNKAGQLIMGHPADVLSRFRDVGKHPEFKDFSTDKLIALTPHENPLLTYFSQEHGLTLQGYKMQPYGREPKMTYVFEEGESMTLDISRHNFGELAVQFESGQELLGQKKTPYCVFLEGAQPSFDDVSEASENIIDLSGRIPVHGDQKASSTTTPLGEYLADSEAIVRQKITMAVFDTGMNNSIHSDAWFQRQKGYLSLVEAGPQFSVSPDLNNPDKTRVGYFQRFTPKSNVQLGLGASSDLTGENYNAFFGGNIGF